MVDLRVTSKTGSEVSVEEAAVEDLKSSLRGGLLRPGDEGCEAARKVWNGNIDRRPGLIIRCAGVADVINSVDFVRTNNLLVSVRGGGHNVRGLAVCDGGLMIDLSLMKGIRVDPVNRTVRAEGGVKWGEFDLETQAFGLATTGGIVADTGIAGLTLGGGYGWLGRKYGLACDNLISVDIVTADGKFLTASASENQDLFWGLRGGGGNFGVVTSFEFQLHPVGPIVLAGIVIHPLDKAKEVLKFYRGFSSDIPDELNTTAALLTSLDGHPRVAIGVCYNGPIEAGEQLIRPVREFGPPLEDHIQPMPYTALQSMLDPVVPPGQEYYEKAPFMDEISDDAIDTIITHFAKVTSPLSMVFFSRWAAP